MQQRAAIARSLVLDCDLLLLDEPFSALDAVVKVDLSEELKELQSEPGNYHDDGHARSGGGLFPV